MILKETILVFAHSVLLGYLPIWICILCRWWTARF